MIWQDLPFKFEVNFDDLSLGGVYVMTMDTGYYYIGSTRNFKSRISVHKTAFRRGCPENQRMKHQALRCLSINFSVLEVINDMTLLKPREDFYLSLKWGDPLLLNVSPSAFGVKGMKRTPEEKEYLKISASERKMALRKGEEYASKGRPIYFKKVINNVTGQIYNSVYDLSAETGRPAKQYARRLNGELKNNTPFTYIEGERHVSYKSEGYTGAKGCSAGAKSIKKPIDQFDREGNLIYRYPSTKAAAKKLGTRDKYIRAVANGKYRQWHGFVFKYA